MQRNHMLLVGQAMGVCLMAAIAFIIPFRRLTGKKTSPTEKEATSLHIASSSTATQDKARIENPFDQIAPSSASTSANNLPCHIFINHRGSDVKHTLASTIYHTLDTMGFRAFLDVEQLQPGDVITAEIQQAMETASLHIAIFSDSYAQSPWCLAELSLMLKTGTKIIPIFYHVQPSDLRWIVEGKGIYADAFSEHEKKGRYTPEKLDEWRKALSTISGYSGYVVTNNEDEGRLLKNIVNRVLNVMKKVPFEVAKHPVGLDEFVQEFERELHSFQIQSHHTVRIAGIWGMGGSGKTTLAKELFNGKSSSFDRSSFIFDVRDTASKNALVDKQKKLLGDLDVHHLPFDNVDEGMGVLANRLNSLRVLIILDDVDHIDQLDALLPQQTNLGSGSLVIVTTRELGVLTSWGVSCIYKMPGLNHLHSQQLFCWHAFLQPSPPSGFEDLVTEFVNVCSSLPLSLKVFGGHLYGKKSMGYWRSELNKISRILPDDIKQRLQVSYNALDKEEQQIFLDVACFFIGEEKSLAIAVWDGSGWSGLHSWETLFNKCLVELNEDNCISMHDHLRDMGRDIASTCPPYRFWLPEQIKKHSQGGTPIRGISCSNYKFYNHDGRLQNCLEELVGNSRSHGLQILHVTSDQFKEESASLSQDGLVWLRWSFFKGRTLPSWLSFRNIRVLELYDAEDLEELWADNVELTELSLADGALQRFPSTIASRRVCSFQSLEYLQIEDGRMLSSLPSRFGELTNLRHLYLSGCAQLKMLPDSFKQLIHLEYLQLSESGVTSLTADFGDLINLRHIDLSYCRGLRTLPVSFKNLIHLEYLNLDSCDNLKLRLDMLENIRKVEYLNFKDCRELEELPCQITKQESLKELLLINCFQLRDLPTDIGQMCKLETLRIDCCPLLTSFPSSLGNLSSLTTLKIKDCKELTSLPISLGNLSSLTTLKISECRKLKSLPISLGNLSSLTTLKISKCRKLKSLPISLGNLSSLATSKISCGDQSMKIGTLPTSVNLKDIQSMGGLVNLQKLKISDCPELDELPNFAGLTSLKVFAIEDCRKVEKIEGLEHCRSLEVLIALTSWELPGIQSLENLERLESVVLRFNTISALKPCIQSLKERPRRMHIGGKRAVRLVEPIVNSLEFPDLTIKETVDFDAWSSVEITEHLEKAVLLCVVNEEDNTDEEEEENFDGVNILLFRRCNLQGILYFAEYYSDDFQGCKVTVVLGKEARVMEAFNKLLAHME